MVLKRALSWLDTQKNVLILSLLYTLAVVFIVRHCYHLFLYGGGSFQTGDWLISNTLVMVRRGCFGSGLFFVADLFELNPLALLTTLQATVTVCIFFSFWYAGVRLKNYDNIFFLLISPLFIMFWYLDIYRSIWKEILGYSAFLPYLFVAGKADARRIVVASVLSCAIYLVAVLAHEVDTFFAPFLIIAAILASRNGQDCVIRDARSVWKFFTGSRYALGITLAYLFIAAVGVSYALTFTTIEDSMLVCKPVMAIPGIHENICKGSIAYLEHDTRFALEQVASLCLNSEGMSNFFLTHVLSFSLFCIYFSRVISFGRTVLYYLGSFMIFVPLFCVSPDWDRLFNHHIYCLSSVFLIYVYISDCNTAQTCSGRRFHIRNWCLLLASFCLFSMPHIGPVSPDRELTYLRAAIHILSKLTSLLCAAF